MKLKTTICILLCNTIASVYGQYDSFDEYPVYHSFGDYVKYNYGSSIGGNVIGLPTRINSIPFFQNNADYSRSKIEASTAYNLGISGGLTLSPIIHKNFIYTFSPDGSWNWLVNQSGYTYNLKHQFAGGYNRFFFVYERSRNRKTHTLRKEVAETSSSYSQSYENYMVYLGSSDYKSRKRNLGLRVLLGDIEEDIASLKYLEIMRISENFYDDISWKSNGWRFSISNPRFSISAEYIGDHLARGKNYAQVANPVLTTTGRFFQIQLTKRINHTAEY
jgi:hypothetical protein